MNFAIDFHMLPAMITMFQDGLNGRMPVQLTEELCRFIEDAIWTFAKTYAETYPHEYIVEEHVDRDLYSKLAHHIDTHGYTDYFYNKAVIYLDYNGYTYWHMGIIINRCVEADTYHRRKQDGRSPKS